MDRIAKRKPQGHPKFYSHRGSKVKLITMADLNQKSLAATRCQEIVDALIADCGGVENISEGVKQLVQHAAVLGVYIESCETKWMNGDTDIPLDVFMRAIDRQRRLLESIGLSRKSRTIVPSLQNYIASKGARP